MKSINFVRLNKEEQEDLLHKKGVYVGKRRTLDQYVLLFQLEGFYVELFYDRYRQHVSFMNVSSDTEVLDRYLEPFNMAELMSS